MELNCEHRGTEVPRERGARWVLGEQEKCCLDFGINYLFCVPSDTLKQKEMKQRCKHRRYDIQGGPVEVENLCRHFENKSLIRCKYRVLITKNFN